MFFQKSVKKFTESFSLFHEIWRVREIRGHIKLWPAILRCVKNQHFDFLWKSVKNGKNRQKCVKKVEKCDFGPRNRPPKTKNAKNVLLIPPLNTFLTHFQNEKCICPKFHENFMKKPGSISQEMCPSIFSAFLYKNMKKH